jgi:uncharacterized protein DUF6600/FecR-like protein
MKITSASSASALLAFALFTTALPAQQITLPSQTPTVDLTPATHAKAAAPATSAAPAPVIAAAPATTATPATTAAPAAAPAQTRAADSIPATTTSTIGVSKVRIVRLSEVRGVVQLDRNTGQGFEAALANQPIIERARLRTGTGVAEVEFEDNSSLRVAPDSLVAFPRLELLPSGAKASTVDVLKGTAYVSLVNTKGNDFILTFGQQKLHLQPSSHVRLQLEPTQAKLAVMDGTAQVEGPSGVTEVGKKKTLTFNLSSQNEPVLAKNVAEEPFDSWDHQSTDYHKRYASLSAFGNSQYSYGVSDLSYYGNFINTGCGSMWRPYFVSAGWDPFSNGAWAYYPGAGYSWVSPYPWGWQPYHSGSWAFCQGAGWGWQPGGSWNGLTNAPSNLTAMRGQPTGLLPRPPARPPLSGQSTLVPVNTKPLTPSALGPSDSFVFRHDSAGLGVPRGSLGKLDKFSQQAAQHGSATAVVYAVPPGSSGPQGNARMPNGGPASSPRPGNATANHTAPQAPSAMAPHSVGPQSPGGNMGMGASRPTSNMGMGGNAGVSGRPSTGAGRPR